MSEHKIPFPKYLNLQSLIKLCQQVDADISCVAHTSSLAHTPVTTEDILKE